VYTDGVAEAADANEALFGTDRTLEALNADSGAAPEQVLKNVRAAIDGFVKEAPQFDDLTMLCLRFNGPESGTAESPAVGEPRTL
jgi:serine phosphatase RsbU (regulator of sigma subunit)